MKGKKPAVPKGGREVAGTVERLLPDIRELIDAAQYQAVTAANLAMVTLYWKLGQMISREIQTRPGRAGYGEALLARLGERLNREYGRGFSERNLRDMRRFSELFEIRQPVAAESAPPPAGAGSAAAPAIRQPVAAELAPTLLIDFTRHFHLGWSHYRLLMSVAEGRARRFYFERACAERWSKRELQRQLAGALYERVALSSDTRALVKLERQKGPVEVADYRDAFKDPYLLDFLGLTGAYSERDLEAAIISNLQQFLTELGSDFCFIRRQYPMRVDDEDYYLDLLFYHRGLRCLVAVDLKIGAFVAADKGQMDLYLSWLKRHEWRQGENEPVGLILCTSKKQQHVELLLAGGPHRMQVSEYLTRLPEKKVLEERLRMYGRLLEEGTTAKHGERGRGNQ